jgi:hypothetical protein
MVPDLLVHVTVTVVPFTDALTFVGAPGLPGAGFLVGGFVVVVVGATVVVVGATVVVVVGSGGVVVVVGATVVVVVAGGRVVVVVAGGRVVVVVAGGRVVVVVVLVPEPVSSASMLPLPAARWRTP